MGPRRSHERGCGDGVRTTHDVASPTDHVPVKGDARPTPSGGRREKHHDCCLTLSEPRTMWLLSLIAETLYSDSIAEDKRRQEKQLVREM